MFQESFSLGRELDVDKVNEIGGLSEKHGFIFDHFLSFEKLIKEENFERARGALGKLH